MMYNIIEFGPRPNYTSRSSLSPLTAMIIMMIMIMIMMIPRQDNDDDDSLSLSLLSNIYWIWTTSKLYIKIVTLAAHSDDYDDYDDYDYDSQAR